MGKINDMIIENGISNPLKLDNPILINNEQVSELSWDADGITADLYDKACALANKGTDVVMAPIEFNSKLHRYLGCAVVIAADQKIDFLDLNQLKGADIFRVATVGRFLALNWGTSDAESSGLPSETMPASITPQSKTSGKAAS